MPLPLGEKDEDDFRPFVKCELHVDKHDEGREEGVIAGLGTVSGGSKDGRYKLSTSCREGCNPSWGHRYKFKFEEVPNVIEELSFIRSVTASIYETKANKKVDSKSRMIRALEKIAWQHGHVFVLTTYNRVSDFCLSSMQKVLLLKEDC